MPEESHHGMKRSEKARLLVEKQLKHSKSAKKLSTSHCLVLQK